MKLSIIIPVFNEEKTITRVIDRVRYAKINSLEKEIIIVDDGSSDKTTENIKNYLSKIKSEDIKFIIHEENQGKGSAIRTGIKNSTGEYIVIQDADLEYNPADIATLIKFVKNGKARVVYGTRLNRLPNLSRDEKVPLFLLHYFGNRFLSLMTSLLYGQWITDMETCYKLFPKSAVDKITLNSKRFDFEPEITAKLLKAGYKILEVPITTTPRDYSEGKKLNTFKDGIIALLTLFRYRFTD